ncbi:hypothetical protein [Nocardia sp. IFM 10818]
MLVGHSYGSRVAYGVASVSEGVDAVVATSLRQNWISYVTLTASPVTTAPAAQDPRFADMGLDPGYVTTRPGRADSGFNEANTDPG